MNPQPEVSGSLPEQTLRAQRLPCTPPGTALGTGKLETPQENWEHPRLRRWSLPFSLCLPLASSAHWKFARGQPCGGWWLPPGVQRTPRLG